MKRIPKGGKGGGKGGKGGKGGGMDREGPHKMGHEEKPGKGPSFKEGEPKPLRRETRLSLKKRTRSEAATLELVRIRHDAGDQEESRFRAESPAIS